MVYLSCWLYPDAIVMLGVDRADVFQQPWTFLTYSFANISPIHLSANVIALLIAGSWFRCYGSDTQLIVNYIFGAVGGALIYVCVTPHSVLLGSSASVFAIVSAAVVLSKSWKIMTLPILMLAIGIDGENSGGMIAHFGGIAAGILFGFITNKLNISGPNMVLEKAMQSGYVSLSESERRSLSSYNGVEK